MPMRPLLLTTLIMLGLSMHAREADRQRVTLYLADGSTTNVYQFRFCGNSAGPGTAPCGPQLRIGQQRYTVLDLRRIALQGDPGRYGFSTFDVYFKDGTTTRAEIGFARAVGVNDLRDARDPAAGRWFTIGSELKEIRIKHDD